MRRRAYDEMPNVAQIEFELNRAKYRRRYNHVLKSTIYTLITVAAIAILVATLWMPVLQIYGNSMTPTLNNGSVVISLRTDKLESGDIVAFYYNNKILCKRLIGNPGDWIDIDDSGNVYVNGKELDEPYLVEKAFGDCNIKLPYQVPDNRYFMMGDRRSVSLDSRNASIGSISEEQIVGKIEFCIWPLKEFGPIK